MLPHMSAAISASRNVPAPKCGMMNGTDGYFTREPCDLERVAEAEIKAARKPELRAHADRKHPAMDEDGDPRLRCRNLHDARDSLVRERHVMHRREEADRRGARVP